MRWKGFISLLFLWMVLCAFTTVSTNAKTLYDDFSGAGGDVDFCHPHLTGHHRSSILLRFFLTVLVALRVSKTALALSAIHWQLYGEWSVSMIVMSALAISPFVSLCDLCLDLFQSISGTQGSLQQILAPLSSSSLMTSSDAFHEYLGIIFYKLGY